MDKVDIKDISGTLLLTPSIEEGSKRKFLLMKEDYITLKFSLETPVHFKLGDYVDDARFGLFEVCDLQKPAYNTSTGGYDYDLRLDAYYWKWKNKIFKYTPEAAGREASWNLTAPLDVQAGVVLRNLKALGYTYKGQDFDISIDSSVEDKSLPMSYDNINILDACFEMAKKWDCECWVTENIIHFGRLEHSDPVNFEIGVNVEDMTRSDSQSNYATRIYAFGSTRNIPANYRPVDESVVVNGVVQRRLMLPVGTPYIDAYPNMRTEETVEQVVVFDDIYPRRVGTMSGITTHEYTDKIEEEGKEPVYRKWNAYRFKDTGITFSKDYVLPGEELKITFQSGKLNGMEFAVTFNPCDKEGGETPIPEKLEDGNWNPAAQVWEIIRNEDYGRELPGDVLIPKDGDTYVLSGWDSTKIAELGLVAAAELELKEKAEAHRDKVKVDPSTYTNRMMCDKDFMPLDAGARVNLINKAFFDTGSRQSRIIGFEYNLDIPYDYPVYTVGETASYSRIAELENKIESITLKGQTYTGGGGSGIYLIKSNDTTPASDSNTYSAKRIQGELEKLLAKCLRKDQPDIAKEIITFLKGLLIGNNGHGITLSDSGVVTAILDELKNVFSIVSSGFVSGDLGNGFILKYDPETGRSYLEVDELLVRKIAYFVELVIKQLRHVGGEIILTPASMTCIKVEELTDAYRCYFQADDGVRSVRQEFVSGDQARCQTFNIKPGTAHNVTNKYYWRLVTAVGDDYIDLSKTDCDTGSGIPAPKDEIVQLGNRTDATRQNAIILSTVGDDAPSIKQYTGIRNYSLAGKAVTVFSPKGNRITGDFVLTNGKTVLESLSASKQLALAISRGEMLFKDPVFKEGNNGLKRYNNGAGSSTVISRIASDDSPNESGYVLSVTTEDAGARPGPGGITWQLDGRANLALVMRIVARIPAGYAICYTAQALGEQTYEWLTPVDGTGDWQEYAVYVKYKNMPAASDGTAHVYKKCGYFYLSGSAPVTWYLSYATVFDVNGVAPSYAVKSEVDSRFQVLSDRVTSEVRSEREFAMMLSKGKMLFKDPTFRNGTNGFYLFNNAQNTVSLSDKCISNDMAPNDTRTCYEFTASGKTTDAKLGGFRFYNISTDKGRKFLLRMIAKIPAGYRIRINALNIGTTGYERTFLNGEYGTGDFHEYLIRVTYGSDASAHTNSEFRIYLEGSVLPLTWQLAYATVFDLDGADPEYTSKTTFESSIRQLSDRITMEVHEQQELTSAVNGRMLYKNPTFKVIGNTVGTNSLYKMDSTGTLSIERLSDNLHSVPNDSGYYLKISAPSGSVPAGGTRWVYWSFSSKANSSFSVRLLAKIPRGRKLLANTYNIGNGSQKWLASNEGTGEWQEYIYLMRFGTDAESKDGNYVSLKLDVSTTADYWYIAYGTVYDLNGSDPLYMESSYAESRFTQMSNQITSEVKRTVTTLTDYANAMQQGTMLHEDPTFMVGTNGIKQFSPKGEGTIISRIAASDAPNDSRIVLNISTPAVPSTISEPKVGGMRWEVYGKANMSVVIRIVAKIPSGARLVPGISNASLTNHGWLTPNSGTGDWKEYIYKIQWSGTIPAGTNLSYGVFYLEGATAPVAWQVSYAAIFDMNGQNPLRSFRSDFNSKVTQLSDRITSEVKKTVTTLTDYANAMQQGTMLHEDPTFMIGTNGIKQFSPKGEGTTISRITASDAPNNSRYVLTISTPATTIPEPKVGGMRWEVYGKANMSVVIRIVAKIPSGAKIAPGISNASLTSHGWVTPDLGTGRWKEYIYKIQWLDTIPAGTNLSYGVFYLEGVTAPVAWQVAYAAIFDMNGQNPLLSVKSEFNSKISQLSDRITSEVKEVQTNALALQRGSMLYEDATFKVPTYSNGKNGLKPYRMVGNADVLISRVSIANCPNDSGYGLEIISKGSGSTFNGITWYLAGKPNRYFVVRMIANIPNGYKLEFHSNSIGRLEYHGWLTENKGAGSGKWEEYVYHIKCGTLFSDNTAYFYISGAAAVSVTWHIAYATIYDMNGDSQLVWKNEYSSKIEQLSNEINMTVNAIGEKTSGSQIRLNPDKIKLAVFGDDGTGKANSLLSAINMDESGVKIKGDIVEVDANKFVARHVQTALSGPRIEMSGSRMDVYGSTALNIRFGVNDEGYAVLRYYDNNGNILYDLGPNGIFKLPSSAEVWTEIRLKRCGDTLVDALTSSHGYKIPYYNNGTNYYTYTSKVVAGVVEDPENDGKIFLYNGSKSTPIPDGCYCHVPLSNSDPRTYWKETVTNQGMEIGSTGRQLTVRDFEELHPRNEPIFDVNPLYSISIFEVSSGRVVDSCLAFWNGG